MSNKTLGLSDEVYEYLLSVSLKETEVQASLRKYTSELPNAEMQIAPEQGQLMTLLVQALHVKNIIEIGVFTGYSSLCMAMALPDDGKIIACDNNEEYIKIARQYWDKAGVSDKIKPAISPAIETLDKLIQNEETGNYDLVFIDALKSEYIDYYERSLKLIKTGGVILVDNVLWYGKPAYPDEHEDATEAIRKFNNHIYNDDRIKFSMLPIGDGLTIAFKIR